jgi:hypothetical protein
VATDKRAAQRQLKETRIRHIMTMMSRSAWECGISATSLAEEWSLSQDTLDRYAGEASRRIREAQFDRETARALIANQLRLIQRLAMGRTDKLGRVTGRELRTAVAAAATLGKILGLDAQTIRMEHTTGTELTPESIADLTRQIFTAGVSPDEAAPDGNDGEPEED